MKGIIQFNITKHRGYYVAEGIDLAIVTDGKTLDELAKNIKEAVELHLENEDLSDYNLMPNPSVLVNFELPTRFHATA